MSGLGGEIDVNNRVRVGWGGGMSLAFLMYFFVLEQHFDAGFTAFGLLWINRIFLCILLG